MRFYQLRAPMEELIVTSCSETEKLGLTLGDTALPGDVICLDGELGAGKTTLTQAIAKGLNVPPAYYITSPSFAILHEYPGRIPLYHMDFYRLHNSQDVEDLGFEEYFYLSGVIVIEWSEKASDLLPEERLNLYLKIKPGEKRIIQCTYATDGWKKRLKENKIF